MKSSDRCMNTDLFGCEGPSYWTLAPILRLCAPCLEARFGHKPMGDQRAADSRRVASPIEAPAGYEIGRDGRPAGAQSSERAA